MGSETCRQYEPDAIFSRSVVPMPATGATEWEHANNMNPLGVTYRRL